MIPPKSWERVSYPTAPCLWCLPDTSACGHIPPVLASGGTWPSLPCVISYLSLPRTRVTALKGSPGNLGSSPHVKVLPLITSAKTLLPFTASRDEDPEIFGGHYPGYYTSKKENEKVVT